MMDVDLDSTTPAALYQPWDSSTQTSSQPATPKHSPVPKRARPKPGNPMVISSILTAFDTLTPLPANDSFSDIASRHSRRDSSTRSVDSGSVSIARNVSSPGFGVEYGRSLELDDEEGLSDAALPPTIPTARPPSGLSNRKKRLSWSKPMPKAYFAARSNSRRSSFSTTSTSDRPSAGKHKLSSESWVRMNNERVERDDWSSISRGRSTHRTLRKVTSQEILRPAQSEASPQRSEDPQSTYLAEQVIARKPPTTFSTKGRLYLTDAAITENQQVENAPHSTIWNADPVRASPPPSPSSAAKENNPISDSKVPSEEHLAVKEPPPKASSPITDSIPTRTSSLRVSSNSPAAGKNRSKKSKRLSSATTKSSKTKHRKSSPILDSSWAGLDEDDETVKRIKQLREQRKSRLQETTTHSHSSAIKPSQDKPDQIPTPVCELSAPLPDEVEREPGRRPAANRTMSEPDQPYQTPNFLGDFDVESAALVLELDYGSFATESPNIGRGNKSSEAKRSRSAQARPTTSRSEHSAAPTVSSDYSNAESVGVPDSRQTRSQHARGRPSRDSAEKRRTSLRLKGFTLPDSQVTALPQRKPSKKPKKSLPDQSADLHSDLPRDFEKKRSRRKSMSDAKAARALDEEEELARQDSIEKAVMDYLYAPRLNRKIKHPTTGRTIAFSEVGDPDGAAVFVCVGMGLTRYVTAFYDELATTLRLRLITLDRPGVGGSEPYPSSDKSGPLNWPEDVLTVSQHLGIVKFSILAHSAGAIYALATALILPHLVKGKVHLLAPWVPPSQLDAISHPAASAPPSNPLPRSQRFLRVLPTPFLKVANSSFMTATSASLQPANKRTIKPNTARTAQRRNAGPTEAPQRPSSHDRPEYNRRESMMLMDQFMPSTHPLDNYPLPVRPLVEDEDDTTKRGSLILSATATPADPSFTYATTGLNAAEHKEREHQSEYTSRLTEYTWDLATRDSNPATDLLVCLERHRDVGFRYTDVGREVVITHGSDDKRVPIANVKWLAEQMNRRALGMNLGPTPPGSRGSDVDRASDRAGGCEVRTLEGEGHGLMASPVIMSDILTEIAGYWLGQDKGRHQ